jgi:hypothetical protein
MLDLLNPEDALDDFIEVSIDGLPDAYDVASAMMDEINGIVRLYGGEVYECGPISSDSEYAPFEEWATRAGFRN